MTGECPSEDQLVRMVEGALASDSMDAIDAHINTCELCQSVVAGLGALNEPPKPRTAVERYQLDRKIGGGGMGEVWAAWDPKLRREVAVKLVRPDRSDDTKERARLLREAQALAKLTHPNVVAVHDVGEVDGEVFIATELVAGDTLASRGGPNADWRVLVGLYAQAARGLAAAHTAGLVHRDVKPSNLLIGVDGRVRVADFGLAVRADSGRPAPSPIAPTETPSADGTGITAAGHIAGTPGYMAPEQRAGDPPEAPADQFALCVALAEGITGRRPPIAATPEAMIAFVGERRPREPALDELCTILARGVSLEPQDRFPDMATLAELLEQLVGIRAPVVAPAPAPRDEPAPRDRPTATTRSRMPIAAAVVALGVGAAALWYLRSDRADDRERAGVPAPAPTPPAPRSAGSGAPPSDAAATASEPPPASAGGGQARGVSDPPARPRATDGKRPAKTVAALSDDAATPPPTPAGGTATSAPSLESIHRAILRRDGKACRAQLAQLQSPPPTDFRVASLHASCEMVAGNCEGGMREVRALDARQGSKTSSAEISADLWCAPGNDPVVRLRRLKQQITMFARTMDCDHYLGPLRAAAKIAKPDEHMTMGSLLSQLAACYSRRDECAKARTVLAEAQVFIPALALDELAPACR